MGPTLVKAAGVAALSVAARARALSGWEMRRPTQVAQPPATRQHTSPATNSARSERFMGAAKSSRGAENTTVQGTTCERATAVKASIPSRVTVG
ncbi:hypothetical protein ACLESO_49515 [Pyxidicoccus sp. 3LG]